MRLSASRLAVLNTARTEPLQGEARYFPRILQIKFLFDVRPVGFNRFRAEMQKLGNLSHVVAFTDQFQDFKFAVAKSLDCIGLAFSPTMRKLRDHLRRHGWAQIRTAI